MNLPGARVLLCGRRGRRRARAAPAAPAARHGGGTGDGRGTGTGSGCAASQSDLGLTCLLDTLTGLLGNLGSLQGDPHGCAQRADAHAQQRGRRRDRHAVEPELAAPDLVPAAPDDGAPDDGCWGR